jgi:antitoxin ParD1/3/4
VARTQTVSLGEHWNDFIDGMLESGRYSSVSELLRASLRLLEEQEADTKVTLLHRAIEAGEASGDAGLLDMTAIKRTARTQASAKGR